MLFGLLPKSHRIFKRLAKGSDQTARISRLILGFAGCTYHIVGNLIMWLICELNWHFHIDFNVSAEKKFQIPALD